eukprot:CAMPEP_0185843686 /NCGR_PEP_ID=MMETSP1354-20130828/105_1 /TAXON_ID=708628 /ORGANISM="Erythrolobus madagascarensis, Strain CCMP3276" /LENGTH=231 /DNA_ID=CAMNT_0028543217 /DNA_START=95 /DNA_END=790 /DNA_ORIENTATION=+
MATQIERKSTASTIELGNLMSTKSPEVESPLAKMQLSFILNERLGKVAAGSSRGLTPSSNKSREDPIPKFEGRESPSGVQDRALNAASPAGRRGSDRSARGGSRVRWSREEDELLKNLVASHGARKWNSLAAHFPRRNAAQLRARWAHRLSDQKSARPFTETEDAWILEGVTRYGTAWRLTAREMDHRLPHDVQNRYKTLMKRTKPNQQDGGESSNSSTSESSKSVSGSLD